MILVGFDFETHLFGPENLAPPPVCLSTALSIDGEIDPDCLEVATKADGDLEKACRDLLTLPEGVIAVGANSAYDLAVLGHHLNGGKLASGGVWPEIFAAVAQGRITDVQVREKLLNLAQHGGLNFITAPDGSTISIDYKLATLARDYLGVDMTAEKTQDDAWRTFYVELENDTLEEWPEEAITYAINDAIYPTQIWRLQEERRAEIEHDLGVDPLATEAFRNMVRLCLYLMSAHGVVIDPREHALIQKELEAALAPENLDLLVEHGILIPGTPPQPHSLGHKDHVEGCKRRGCDCPPKMTKGTRDKIRQAALGDFILDLAKQRPKEVEVRYTDTGKVSTNKEFMEDHRHLSPVLEQYYQRQAVMKLVSTDMPRMEWPKGSGTPAKVLHASFDFLKETGRTSSFASKGYPSWNCQNPHPRVRAAVVARKGYVLYSIDYSGMELGTLAQKCYSLFGQSVLRDVINRGWDAHAYLGAYLAFFLDDDFNAAVEEACGHDPTGDQLYQAFKGCEASEEEATRKFYKHYRTFAKPTGLGYPGGLGPETFVAYAHATYGIECTVELATELREVWHRAFPEMRLYLDWIQESCQDPSHPDKFAYLTPLGMFRAGASYCAAANGAGLQSPSAEGALLALCRVVEATFADVGSVLYDDEHGPRHRPQLFIHDELIGEAREDCAHEVAHEVARIMVESMSVITPDVKPAAEPVLMHRWDKSAKAVYKSGRLVPWEP